MAEMADLRRFIGDHFEKQQALLMGLSGVKTPKQLWPFVAKGDVTSSPCDLSMDEIPIEVYNGIAPQPTKAALEVEEEGILFKSPENYTLKNFEKKAQSAAELLKQKRRCSMVTQMDRDSSARSVAKLIVKSPFFAYAVTSIITFNLIILGIEVDVSTKLGQEDIPEWFGICNLIVVILFTLEMSISLFAQGCGVFFCGRERWWNLFDLLIIIVSVLGTILDFWATSESSQHVSASQLRFVRTVRLARALRGIRVMRLLRYVSALRTLVLSIMSSMASLLWTLVLLMLLFYSFGVLFTQLVSDECRFQSIVNTQDHNAVPRCEDESSEYWSSINESMLTLFMSITGGVDWEIALKPLRRISILAVICLVLYITVTFFAIVNVITGVFVTTAMETTSADKDLVVMKQLQKRNTQVEDLKHLFSEISGGESLAQVGIDEFKQAMSTTKFSAFLHSMGISTEDVGVLFKLLDADTNGLVDLDEFVTGCLNLHGTAKSSQLARMSYENKLTRREIKSMQRSLADLHIVLRMMCENWSV